MSKLPHPSRLRCGAQALPAAGQGRKGHNAEAILFDYQVLGEPLWQRFNGGAAGTRAQPYARSGGRSPHAETRHDCIVLERMQKQLTQMTAAHVAAEEHLSKLAVDQASVEKVVRDTPM